ncbi:hypothetical protein C8R44DRAFT_754342 [Mycena epipterygia]|nr:hypothetical protein C8R44DRAFT_754342 [Mycena epipterygia]
MSAARSATQQVFFDIPRPRHVPQLLNMCWWRACHPQTLCNHSRMCRQRYMLPRKSDSIQLPLTGFIALISQLLAGASVHSPVPSLQIMPSLKEKDVHCNCGTPEASVNDGGLHASEGTPEYLSHKLERDWQNEGPRTGICDTYFGEGNLSNINYSTPPFSETGQSRHSASQTSNNQVDYINTDADPTSMGGGKYVWSNRMAVDIASGRIQWLTGKDVEMNEDEWNEHGC